MNIAVRKAAALLVTLAIISAPFASVVAPMAQAEAVSNEDAPVIVPVIITPVITTPECTNIQTLNTDTNTCVDNPVTPPVVPDNFKVSGVVFNDLNTNDHYNSGEPLLKGWTVKLHQGGKNGPVIAHDTTDAGGNYFFGHLLAGTYFVEEITQDGWDQTTSDTHVNLSSENSDVTVNFANTQNETNGDGGNGGDNGGGGTPTPYVPQTGGLIVTNIVSGGTATPDMFSFSFNGIASTTFTLGGTNNFFAIATGTYNIAETATTTYTTTYANCAGVIVATNATSTCTITNAFITPTPVVVTPPANNGSGGGSTPTSVSSGGGGGGGGYVASGPMSIGFVNTNTTGGGLVLGTSTENTSSAVCSTPLLKTFMRAGLHNSKGEVTKLQNFLNTQLGLTIPVTGFFGSQTTTAVNTFQTKYQNDVLSPWSAFGHDGHTPTGYVYKTTQHEINKLACGNLNVPTPQLP